MTDVRRSVSRAVTRMDWLESRHSFAYGAHYDPLNVSFGPLLVHNEDVLAPGTGFSPHRHSSVVIVTWVLAGALEHQDSLGHRGTVTPGLVQVLSAGSGVEHVERNASTSEPVHYVQVWLWAPEAEAEAEAEAAYAVADVRGVLETADLVPVVTLPGAVLSVGRLPAGAVVALPGSAYVHLFLARGEATVGDDRLAAGDAVRLTAAPVECRSTTPSEVLVWAMDEPLGP